MGDTINPSVTINSPADRFNTTSTSVSFQFTPTDNSFTTLACNLSVDSVLNNTNATAVNNTATTLASTGFAEGNHNWNMTCADGDGNQNTSTTRIFTVDTSAPVLNALTNNPSTTDGLDPGVRIAFFANVSDNFTAVNTVILQQKLTTVSDFSNVSMTFNSSNGLYEAGFTPTANGTYNVRVFATDILNNQGQSVVVNLTVQNEATWTRSPASVAVGTTPNKVISFTNITLNNTGDVPLNFTTISTFSATTFNTTFPLLLLANEVRIVEVNVTAPSTTGATQFQIEINASPNANPTSQNISATLAVTEGQPFLAATFTDVPTSKTKGDSFTISGQIENIGTGNATNASLYFTLPTDWEITGGELNNSVGDLDVGTDPVERSLSITIPSNASDGLQTVKVNASGYNSSNVSLESLNLISGDERTVNVTNVTVLAPGPVAVPAITEEAAAGAAVIPSTAPSEVTGALKLTPAVKKQFLETYETVYVIRGENMTFPLNMTNIYNRSQLHDVRISIDGYLAKYLHWEPEQITTLSFGETKQFMVTVAAPTYKEREEHNLTITATGMLEGTVIDYVYNKKTKEYETRERTEKVKLIETRHVTLIILETTVIEATEKKEQAKTYLDLFKERGIGTTKIEALLTTLQEAYAAEQFAEVVKISQEIESFATMVLETDEILKEVRERYETLKEQSYDVEEWNGLITLAEMAFAEENFESAYLRAKEAQLYQAVAVEQQFNLTAFLEQYWKELGIGLLITLGVSYFTQRRIFLLTVGKQLAQLDRREEQTEILKEEAQRECFTLKKISTLTYHKRMYQYELLLDTIRKKRYELQKKKQRLLTEEEMLLFLKRDNAQVLEKIKEIQNAYYNKMTMAKSEYLQKSAFYKNRLAQNEKESAVIEAALQQEVMLKDQLRKEIITEIWLLDNQQMKKPPMQNIGGIIADVSSYVYLVAKEGIKWTLFSAKEMYDLLLLKMMGMHLIAKNKEIQRQKEVQEDLAVAEELLTMVAAEKKQYNKGNRHAWHIHDIMQSARHAITTSIIKVSWILKKKKTEFQQRVGKEYTEKRWSWKAAYRQLSYKSYFRFEEWKWKCKELLLHARS